VAARGAQAAEVVAKTIQEWARDYVTTSSLAAKLEPSAPPADWADDTAPLRLEAPGRPSELDLVGRTKRSIPRSQMANPAKRGQLIHTFLHHELQAAELMCWALLAFPATPIAFRRGLLGICLDEIRHMGLYREHLQTLGFVVSDFPVRDWFWHRVARCETPLQFVALMGMGLEGGNLDHTLRYERWFREVGDQRGAEIQRVVGDEEIAHVKFAVHWFAEWTNGVEFDQWRRELIDPLTPTMMKGACLDATRRSSAGFPDEFVEQLRAWDR
jgi:uncharacterized ferritin-like protein (DUF455 family)